MEVGGRENPRRHSENMLSPHGKTPNIPTRGFKPGSFLLWQVLTTTPPCRPQSSTFKSLNHKIHNHSEMYLWRFSVFQLVFIPKSNQFNGNWTYFKCLMLHLLSRRLHHFWLQTYKPCGSLVATWEIGFINCTGGACKWLLLSKGKIKPTAHCTPHIPSL